MRGQRAQTIGLVTFWLGSFSAGAMIDGTVAIPSQDFGSVPIVEREEGRVEGRVESPQPSPQPTAQPETIMEDDPRWDCETMGNRICGPTTTQPTTATTYEDEPYAQPQSPENPNGWDTFDQCVTYEGVGDGGLATCADIFDLPCGDPRVDPHREDC